MSIPEGQSPESSEDAVEAQLDSEIASLQSQISSLKEERKLQTATILSSHATQVTLGRLRKAQAQTQSSSSPEDNIPSDTNPLFTASKTQLLHNQENLYRACGTLTTFRVRDPDPGAVDDGNVLGIRIDVSTAGKFINPYYVLLNKPFLDSELLRVHRHTLPPYIPLSALVEKHLPTGKGATAINTPAVVGGKRQDLRRFARALRREIVAYHNRITAIKSLRKDFKLDETVSRKGKGREKIIADISAADAEATQIRIEWTDGRIGRCVVDEDGNVIKCVVMGEEGRDRETERAVLRGRIEGIGERLREGIY